MTYKPKDNKPPQGKHDALDTLMELVSGMPSHPVSPSESATPLWLGATLGQERLAIRLTDIGAVFKSTSTSAAHAARAPLDLEMHAGMPVFMTSFETLFEPSNGHTTAIPSALGEWVVVRRHLDGTHVGCRVQSVHGPFHALADDKGCVTFEGKRWSLYAPKGLTHA